MQMRQIRGKNLIAAGYDPVTGTLRVAFNKSGEYDYSEVPEGKFVSLCRVPYPDSYYSKAIKGKFPCVKVADPPEEPNAILQAQTDDARHNSVDRPAIPPERSGGVDPGSGTESGCGVPRVLPVGRCDATSTGGRVMEVFFPADGVEFHETDANGQPCHFYTLKGVRVPFSLTQVLELSGISRQPTSATEIAARPAAATRGTKVHEATLFMDQNDFDLESLKPWPEYYARCLGWQQFKEDFHFQPDINFCEVPIAVRVNGMLYGMKLDAYGCIGEGGEIAMAVVEKKTTASEEDSHAIQTAGQAIAFKSHAESLQMPLRRYCVYLNDKENGGNRYYRCVEHTERGDEKLFAAALTLVYWRKQKGLL